MNERTLPTTPGPETSAPPAPLAFHVLEERFDRHESLPDGWTSEAEGWTVARDASAPSPPNVLRGNADSNSSISLRSPVRFAEFDATLLLRIDAGHEGAGLVFGHAEDDQDVVLYTPRDSRWRLVSNEDGQSRESEGTAVPAIPSEEWIAIRVLLEGTRLQTWQNSVLVLDVADVGDLRAGEVGPFVARGMTASFDELRVAPLTR